LARKPESRRQRRIRAALLREVGGYWRKIHVSDFMGAGFPDLLGFVRGYAFAFEVKEPGEEPSAIQRLTIKEMRRKGGACAAVVVEPEEAVALVRARLRRNEPD
jgi:hypothetical protein